MQCTMCDARIPDDARFCIICGAAVTPAQTGQTQRLRPSSSVLRLIDQKNSGGVLASYCERKYTPNASGTVRGLCDCTDAPRQTA
jgi:hypothetical protein